MSKMDTLKAHWQACWPQALALWSKFIQLREPVWCLSLADEEREGLGERLVQVHFVGQVVAIGLRKIQQQGLGNFPLEIMGHAIGHHIFCPMNRYEQGRLVACIHSAMPEKPSDAAQLANLYADLIVRYELSQRAPMLKFSDFFQHLNCHSHSRFGLLYLRIHEILWQLPRKTLAEELPSPLVEADARLGARIIQHYRRDWLAGAGYFATLCESYLIAEGEAAWPNPLQNWMDTMEAGENGIPMGLTEKSAEEIVGQPHPAFSESISAVTLEPANPLDESSRPKSPLVQQQANVQYREPLEYHQLLTQIGFSGNSHESALFYYRERAQPYLIPFPRKPQPADPEPQPEGLITWETSSPMEEVDWLESLLASPHIVPGITTLQRSYGPAASYLQRGEPFQLDLFMDSSGSMPNPQQTLSYYTFAATILVLSALRAGAKVRVTLWSGPTEVYSTQDFSRDEISLLKMLTGYVGGTTTFPLEFLKQSYPIEFSERKNTHLVLISDDGITSLFATDEEGQKGRQLTQQALSQASGGTLLLKLFSDWREIPELRQAHRDGWQIHRVMAWDDLLHFAQAFSQSHYSRI